jgi:hypothetical protein
MKFNIEIAAIIHQMFLFGNYFYAIKFHAKET